MPLYPYYLLPMTVALCISANAQTSTNTDVAASGAALEAYVVNQVAPGGQASATPPYLPLGARANIQQMSKADMDGDGQVSEAEKAAFKAQMQQRMQQMQQMQQMRQQMRQQMPKADTDGDGQVSEAEKAAFKAQMQQRMQQMPK